jgi:hypothetical protein
MDCPNCGGGSVRIVHTVADLFRRRRRDTAPVACICRDCGFRWETTKPRDGEKPGPFGKDIPIVLSSDPPGYPEQEDAAAAAQSETPAAAGAVPAFTLRRPESGKVQRRSFGDGSFPGRGAADASSEQPADGRAFCRSCGCELLPASRFCSKCGAKQ